MVGQKNQAKAMKFLVDHPLVKWLMISIAIGGPLIGYAWHVQETRAVAIQERWLELDLQWNADIISRLERIEDILVGAE